jgi:flagellar biosynthesis/type III secretory pathway protein FliH
VFHFHANTLQHSCRADARQLEELDRVDRAARQDDFARGAQLVPDASVLPGGCRVETPRQAVDATVQTRWRTALAALGRDDAWIEA